MKKKITVAVLAGGDSAEREISLESGEAVATALKQKGFNVLCFDPKNGLAKFIQAGKKIDVVFPALHGRGGEDGTIQGLLEFLKIPFVGSGMLGMITSFNKVMTKSVYRANKLPVARDFIANKSDSEVAKKAWKKIGIPAFVKPVTEGSSFGASLIQKKSELLPALKRAWKFGSVALVEEYLKGTEISVGVLESENGLRSLPPIEICSKKKFFDLKAKYDPKFCEEIVPARISPELIRQAQSFAKAAHCALGLKDLSRTDMIIVGKKIYLLETNALPGFTKNSLYPKEAKAAGIEFPNLIEHLIQLNFSRHKL